MKMKAPFIKKEIIEKPVIPGIQKASISQLELNKDHMAISTPFDNTYLFYTNIPEEVYTDNPINAYTTSMTLNTVFEENVSLFFKSSLYAYSVYIANQFKIQYSAGLNYSLEDNVEPFIKFTYNKFSGLMYKKLGSLDLIEAIIAKVYSTTIEWLRSECDRFGSKEHYEKVNNACLLLKGSLAEDFYNINELVDKFYIPMIDKMEPAMNLLYPDEDCSCEGCTNY